MEVLEAPSDEIAELLAELEYEPEAVAIPGVGVVTVRTVAELPLELLALLEESKAEISGRRVWPGSVLLALAMTGGEASALLKGSAVLELGSGSGLASIVAAKLGASLVVVTDGDQTSVDLSVGNLGDNGLAPGVGGGTDGVGATVVARRLLWGDFDGFLAEGGAAVPPHVPAGGYDVVLAADVMYKPFLPPLLFGTVKSLLRPGGCCLLCHVIRAGVTHELVVAAAEASGLRVTLLPLPREHFPHEHCSEAEADGAKLYRIEHA